MVLCLWVSVPTNYFHFPYSIFHIPSSLLPSSLFPLPSSIFHLLSSNFPFFPILCYCILLYPIPSPPFLTLLSPTLDRSYRHRTGLRWHSCWWRTVSVLAVCIITACFCCYRTVVVLVVSTSTIDIPSQNTPTFPHLIHQHINTCSQYHTSTHPNTYHTTTLPHFHILKHFHMFTATPYHPTTLPPRRQVAEHRPLGHHSAPSDGLSRAAHG